MTPSARRIVKFASALMLVVGGSGLALWAQPPQAVGTWTSMGAVAQARTGAAAVVLDDGRTLVAGGTAADGTVTDSVLIYDPQRTHSPAPVDCSRRGSATTATLLADGHVLIAGGRLESGERRLELFDPASGTSTLRASMAQPRTGHAAARLADGTVMIVGGIGGRR